MKMKVCKSSSSNLFLDSAIRGNADFIRSNMKFAGQLDSRQTSESTIQGFAAIHHAVLNNNNDIVDLLLPVEGQLLTDGDSLVYLRNLKRHITIHGGSTILHLAVLCSNTNAMALILKMDMTALYHLLPLINSVEQTALSLAIQFNTAAGILMSRSVHALRGQLLVLLDNENTHVHYACRYLNMHYFRLFFQLFQGDYSQIDDTDEMYLRDLKEYIGRISINRNKDNQTFADIINEELSYEDPKVTREEEEFFVVTGKQFYEQLGSVRRGLEV